MTTASGPQMGVTLYSFTNEWPTRQFDLAGLMHEVARRGLGPNIEIIGFQPPRAKRWVSDGRPAAFAPLSLTARARPRR